MPDFTGEDLLHIFDELSVSLHGLNPNVIKAWFDTDDKDMKNLLSWMCTSLSKKNYLCPLEYNEFLDLDSPLTEEEYTQECKKIDLEYPDIFDDDTNKLEIEFIEDEIRLFIEEEEYLDNLIRMNEQIQRNLSDELTEKTSEEIKISLKLERSQELCNSLGKQLDEINIKLHSQLIKYGLNLYNFEFSVQPTFINNLNIKECEEIFTDVVSYITPMLEDDFLLANITTDLTGLENGIILDSLNKNNSVINSLNTLRHSNSKLKKFKNIKKI